MKSFLILALLLISFTNSVGQVFTNKVVGEKNRALKDSLMNKDYPYSLPIWGAKVTKAGYHLPYSAGLSLNYFWSENGLIIQDLFVGFNNGPMYDLDEIVRFEDSKATAQALTLRPDVWVFPFLNVYGILGTANASTDVNFGVWVPDSTGVSQKVLTAGTNIAFTTTTFGFGMTPTIGVGGGFLAIDINMTWTDAPQLKDPARTFVFGPRMGKNFALKAPNRSVAVWVGGFRVSLRSETDGSVSLADIYPDDGSWGARVDDGIARVGEYQQQVDVWWSGLSPIEQTNPVNQAKYDRANQALNRAGEVLNSADAALGEGPTSTVQYSMNKKVEDAWNFIIGTQFQYNKHYMIRGEVGFLGSRTQVMFGLQYRFGL